jgi:hypothetical protein
MGPNFERSEGKMFTFLTTSEKFGHNITESNMGQNLFE